MTWTWQGGRGAQDLPQWAHMHLVTVLKVDPNYTARMQCVLQIGYNGNALAEFFRSFNPESVKMTIGAVKDFAALDKHPELILYEGYIEKESGNVYIERRSAPEMTGLSQDHFTLSRLY